jgi:hypothetical protein
MKTLFSTDYVVYDTLFDNVSRWESNKEIVIYGSKEDAQDDICPETNEIAIPCTELPPSLQDELVKQINKY